MNQSRKFSLAIALLTMSAVFGACGYSEEEMQAKKDEISALNAKLSESVERGVQLDARLKEMTDKNNELMERLNLSGDEKKRDQDGRRPHLRPARPERARPATAGVSPSTRAPGTARRASPA